MVNWTALSGVALAMAAYLVPVFALLAFIWISKRVHYRKDRRGPISKGLLRSPGHAVAKALEDARFDLITCFAVATPLPLFLLAGWAAPAAIFGIKVGVFPWTFLLVIALGAALLFWKVFVLIRRIRQLSLGLEAETAIGQELNQLLSDGYHVFHDLVVDDRFNIDHVVVGKGGAFAIETKGRSKPVRRGKPEFKVTVAGDRLEFPGWKEVEPLQQARRNAQWLSQWLSGVTGETTEVKPVLMLPGWWIERSERTDVVILNGTNCRASFSRLNAKALSNEQLRRAVHHLEAQCRQGDKAKN